MLYNLLVEGCLEFFLFFYRVCSTLSMLSFTFRKDIKEAFQMLVWWYVLACNLFMATSLSSSICTCIYEGTVHQSYRPYKHLCGLQNTGDCLCFCACSWLQILIFIAGRVPIWMCTDGSVGLIKVPQAFPFGDFQSLSSLLLSLKRTREGLCCAPLPHISYEHVELQWMRDDLYRWKMLLWIEREPAWAWGRQRSLWGTGERK